MLSANLQPYTRAKNLDILRSAVGSESTPRGEYLRTATLLERGLFQKITVPPLLPVVDGNTNDNVYIKAPAPSTKVPKAWASRSCVNQRVHHWLTSQQDEDRRECCRHRGLRQLCAGQGDPRRRRSQPDPLPEWHQTHGDHEPQGGKDLPELDPMASPVLTLQIDLLGCPKRARDIRLEPAQEHGR